MAPVAHRAVTSHPLVPCQKPLTPRHGRHTHSHAFKAPNTASQRDRVALTRTLTRAPVALSTRSKRTPWCPYVPSRLTLREGTSPRRRDTTRPVWFQLPGTGFDKRSSRHGEPSRLEQERFYVDGPTAASGDGAYKAGVPDVCLRTRVLKDCPSILHSLGAQELAPRHI